MYMYVIWVIYTIFLNRFLVKGLHNCFYLRILAETSLFYSQYISEMYHEDPEAYTKECNEFDQLRQVCVQTVI